MKIFLSWSGKPSQNVAMALKDWLPLLFSDIQPFFSPESIRKGKRWQIEIAKELDTTNFGIACLTHDNLESPWLVYESGALSKSVKESSVSTLLLGGLRPSDVDGPLSHFQHTTFEKEDFFKLITAINEAQATGKQDSSRLRKVFDKFWEELAGNVEKALKSTEKPEKHRSNDDMLRELLDVTNSIAKYMPTLPGLLQEVRKRYGAPLLPEIAAEKQILVDSETLKTQEAAHLFGRLLAELRSINSALAVAIEVRSIRPVFEFEQKRVVLYFTSKKRMNNFSKKGLPHIFQALNRIGLPWQVLLKHESEAP